MPNRSFMAQPRLLLTPAWTPDGTGRHHVRSCKGRRLGSPLQEALPLPSCPSGAKARPGHHSKMASMSGSPLSEWRRNIWSISGLFGQWPGPCSQDTSDWGSRRRGGLPGPRQGASVPWLRACPKLPGGRKGSLGQQMSGQERCPNIHRENPGDNGAGICFAQFSSRHGAGCGPSLEMEE